MTKLPSRSNKALGEGIQLSEAMTGDGATMVAAGVVYLINRRRSRS